MSKETSRFVDRTICYIDLLGFSSAVMDRANKDPDDLEKLADLLDQTKSKLDSSYSDAELAFQSLSDSIFVATRDNKRESLTALVSCVQDIYLHFLTNGFLARGGACSGKCFITNYIVLGEPVVRAVKLEQSVADNPRIVLNNKTVKIFRESFDKDYFSRNIRRGDDGPYWIDPFQQITTEVLDYDRQVKSGKISSDLFVKYRDARDKNIRILNSISNEISLGLERIQEDRRVFSMYYWMYKAFSAAIEDCRSQLGTAIEMPEYRV